MSALNAIAILSLQLGTVTLAGWLVGWLVGWRLVSRVCRVSVRVRPAVSWAPRVRAHEFRLSVRPSVRHMGGSVKNG